MTVPSYSPAQTRAKPVGSLEKLALVLPTLHEAANLRALLNDVRRTLQRNSIPWELIVVDDNSRDGTAEIAAAIAREDQRVRLLVRRGQCGLAGAILHGWQHTDATILGAMDADGQHPAEVLPQLIASIVNGQDLAIGSRYAQGGCRDWNFIRRLLSLAATAAARPLQPSWPRVTDPLSGIFMVRRRCVDHVLFQAAGFKLLLEILVRGRIQSVEEIPFAFGRRQGGRSKMSGKVAWDYAGLLARLYRERFAMARLPQAGCPRSRF